jgi:uncharacterized protein YrzB (UPF0473 family)
MDNEKTIIITDSEGKEHIMEILFTYDHEERGTSYVFFFDPAEPENVIAMRYTENGELEDILDDEEYDEVEEVFNAFMEDPKIQEAKN